MKPDDSRINLQCPKCETNILINRKEYAMGKVFPCGNCGYEVKIIEDRKAIERIMQKLKEDAHPNSNTKKT